jgi:hypothetical protein
LVHQLYQKPLDIPNNFKERFRCRFAAETATDDYRDNFKLQFTASRAGTPAMRSLATESESQYLLGPKLELDVCPP